MRLFGYYVWHSFVNQVRKIFRTKIIIFIIACALLGGLAGAIGGSMAAQRTRQTEMSAEKEKTKAADRSDKGRSAVKALIRSSGLTGQRAVFVFISAGIIILFLFFIGSSDAGGSIFLPADAGILFPSPLEPQSVLMFRLFVRMGSFVFLTVYLVICSFAFADMIKISLFSKLMLILAWILAFITAKLFQILFYLLCDRYGFLKKSIKYAVTAALVLIISLILSYQKIRGIAIGTAADHVLNFRGSTFIPCYGWLKGMAYYGLKGNVIMAVTDAILSAFFAAFLVILIYRQKACYYESALEKTAQIEKQMEKVQKMGLAIPSGKAKHKSLSAEEEGIGHGRGASVFFFKDMKLRFREKGKGLVTRTSVIYLAISFMAGVIARDQWGIKPALAAFTALSLLVFYRSFQNESSEDLKTGFYRMIPESPWKKLFFSLAGGSTVCCLDLLPSVVLLALAFRPAPAVLLIGFIIVITTNIYSSIVRAFIDSVISDSIDQSVHQVVFMTFLMFGLLPDFIILYIGYMKGDMSAYIPYIALVNVLVACLFFSVTPVNLEDMRVRADKPSISDYKGDLKSAAHDFSTIGLGLALIIILSIASQFLISKLIMHYFPGVMDTSWGSWAVVMLPEYLIGFPAGLAVIKRVKAAYYKDRPLGGREYLLAIPSSFFVMVAGALVGFLVLFLLGLIFPVNKVSGISVMSDQGPVYVRILFMVILAPLIEEYTFRRTLIDRLRPYGERTAIVFQAAAFGLFHGNFSQIFYAMGLGLILGAIYEKTGRLRYSISLHMLINFLGGIVSPLILSAMQGKLSGFYHTMAIVYLAIYYGLAIAGIAVFFISMSRLRLYRMEKELPSGATVSTVCWNPGVMVFALSCAALIFLQTAA